MIKFKVGDRLRFLGYSTPISENFSVNAQKGAIAEVTDEEYTTTIYGTMEPTKMVKVRWLDDLARGQQSGAYFVEGFELVEEEDPKMIHTPGKTYINNNQKAICVGLDQNGKVVMEATNGKLFRIEPSSPWWPEYVEPRKGKVWVNIYPTGSYSTKEDADKCAGKTRIACIEVDWVEGQGL